MSNMHFLFSSDVGRQGTGVGGVAEVCCSQVISIGSS